MQLSRLSRSLLMAQRGPRLSPPDGEGGGSGGDSSGTTDGDSAGKTEGGSEGKDGKDGKGDDAGKVTFSAEQEAHIGKLLSAERKAAADKARADAKAEADAKATADAKAKADADAKAKGDFEAVETGLRADLKTAQDEATAAKAENDQLREAMKSGIEAGWKELPAEVRAIGEKSHPEGDVLGRWAFLHDADTQALVKKLTGAADARRGNEGGPKGNGSGKLADEDKSKAQRPMYARF